MLTPAFATVVLSHAISSCYLPDSEGNIKKALPEGVKVDMIKETIQKITFTSEYTREIFSILVDACVEDMDFDAFMMSVFNCDTIAETSFTFSVAESYLKDRGII